MFEYHEPNLTIDADGVSVTLKLAEPLDIEKPLASLDLMTAEPISAKQQVVKSWEIDELKQDYVSEADGADEYDDGYFEWMSKHPVNGFNPIGPEPRDYRYDDDPDDYEIGGGGNEEVLERVVPYLELGVRGLLAWCAKESQELEIFKAQAIVRSQEVLAERKIREIAAAKALKEEQEREAAELERAMPRRDRAIAYEELMQFIQELGLEREAHQSTFWTEIDGKKLHLYYTSYEMGPLSFGDNKYWRGKSEGIRLDQETPIEKYNSHMGEVTVSERGYFAAGKRGSITGRTGDYQDFLTIPEALESLIPFVLEGEVDSTFNLGDKGPSLPGLPGRRRQREDNPDLEL